MQETISNLETYGYIFLFFYSLGGGLVGIVSAGVLSALGKLDLTLSILIASLGNIIGSFVLAYLGRYQRAEMKKYIIKHRRKVALVYLWLRKYGIALIVLNKYIYGFKTILPLVVGISRYSLMKFFAWNLFASIAWGVLMGFCGFFASSFAIQLFEQWKEYPYILPLLFFLLIGIIWLILKSKEK